MSKNSTIPSSDKRFILYEFQGSFIAAERILSNVLMADDFDAHSHN